MSKLPTIAPAHRTRFQQKSSAVRAPHVDNLKRSLNISKMILTYLFF